MYGMSIPRCRTVWGMASMDRMNSVNTLRQRALTDEGLSLVEIMVSVTILFIVVTAMLPMLLQTTNMAAQAKAQSAITNAVSSYIEEIRALPYEQIAVVGSGVPSASVDATRQVSIGAYTVNMTAEINPVDGGLDGDSTDGDEDYKELVIVAVATADGKPALSSTLTTYIWGQTGIELSVPNVAFGSTAPAEGEVLATYALVSANAEATAEGGTITRVEFTVGTVLLKNVFGEYAQFIPETATWSDSFQWHTTALNASDELIYGDGPQILKVQVWDNYGNTNYVTRTIIIDNNPPDPATNVRLVSQGVSSVRASWDAATDGIGYAGSYNYRVHTAPLSVANEVDWPVSEVSNVGATSVDIAAAPFSRYFVDVQSVSVGGIEREDWVSSADAITNPLMSGTYTQWITEQKKNKEYRLRTVYTVDVSDPQFAIEDAVVYDVFRATSLSGLNTAVAANTPWAADVAFDSGTWSQDIVDSTVYALSSGSNKVWTPTYYYVVRATFTPSGGESTTILSNVTSIPGVEVTGIRTVTGTMVSQ